MKLTEREYDENSAKAFVVCLGCKYLVIGKEVYHNHCDYDYGDRKSVYFKKANGENKNRCNKRRESMTRAEKKKAGDRFRDIMDSPRFDPNSYDAKYRTANMNKR